MCFIVNKVCWRLVGLPQNMSEGYRGSWSPFDDRKACWRLVDVRGVRFDYRKACWRLVEVLGFHFVSQKARMKLADVYRVRSEYWKTCWTLVDVLAVCFDQVVYTIDWPIYVHSTSVFHAYGYVYSIGF